jgi:hypothetical protein
MISTGGASGAWTALTLPQPQETIMANPSRPAGRESEYENERPDRDGQPPRPANEPKGSEGSSNSGETATDPATGKPNP